MERDATWKAKADCRDMGPDLFFQSSRMPDAMWLIQKERAKRICVECKVQDDCYSTAVANGERNGIWGGVDFEETARERKRQRRQIYALKLKK